jgi:ATP-dependent Zn protease
MLVSPPDLAGRAAEQLVFGRVTNGADRVAGALLEKETLVRDEVEALLADVPAESHSSELVGVTQVVPLVELVD